MAYTYVLYTEPITGRAFFGDTVDTDKFVQASKILDGETGSVIPIVSVTNSQDLTSGALAVGLMAQFDDTSPSAVTENRFATVRMSARRVIYVEGPLAHDAAFGTVNPIIVGGYAKATAPTAVSADGDAVQAWFTLNGAMVQALTVGTTLVSDTAPLPVVMGINSVSKMSKANFTATSSGDTQLVVNTSGQTTKVYRFFLMNTGSADVSIKFRSSTTDLCPAILLRPGGSWVMDHSGDPWFTTATNEALNLNLSAAGSVVGSVYYIKSA